MAGHKKVCDNCPACGGQNTLWTTYEDTGYSWFCDACGDGGGEPYSYPEGVDSIPAMQAREQEANDAYVRLYGQPIDEE